MKKTLSTLLLTIFIFPTIGLANIAQAESLNGEIGRDIGTEEKIVIYPPYPIQVIRVLSPNGGEIWNKDEIQTIKWAISYPIVYYKNGKEEKCANTNGNGNSGCLLSEKVSIDLYKRLPVTCTTNETKICPAFTTEFVKHIATVNLKKEAYSWKIGKDIENGNNYIIRISFKGEGVYEDESDGTFTITSKPVPPRPDLTETIRVLEELRTTLEQQIQALIKIIDYLRGLAVNS